ncbi:glutathione-dependent formaldehyde-activating enzyme [Colletotrichum melonis]|uniref:Glutathione-dependent formaldehyde-activating enzyme n=1 Tax=Colletotrichum melonis TaxID=1209925 RepID=A0AAI9UHN8_9PEZI|nr:glutathione-dependent formaldehyde-activating enzyme [Colletotrichum melonis]
MDVECQCGTVTFKTPAPEPLDIYCCHCSQCRKQSASAFARPTKSGGHMDCFFCRLCGSRVFHRTYDENGVPKSTVSIKGGLILGLKMDRGKHIWMSSAVVRISDDAERYNESPPATPDSGKD